MRTARLFVLLPWLVQAACASAPASRPSVTSSSLERRQMQSRDFPDCDRKAVLVAILGTLQDEAFALRTVDAELGLVSATREEAVKRGGSVMGKVARMYLRIASYGLIQPAEAVSAELEATVRIEEPAAGVVRVRVSLLSRVRGEGGRLMRAEEVLDPATYQSFLARVDKNLFLGREAL